MVPASFIGHWNGIGLWAVGMPRRTDSQSTPHPVKPDTSLGQLHPRNVANLAMNRYTLPYTFVRCKRSAFELFWSTLNAWAGRSTRMHSAEQVARLSYQASRMHINENRCNHVDDLVFEAGVQVCSYYSMQVRGFSYIWVC